jgi:CheY-like chemotaxis protein
MADAPAPARAHTVLVIAEEPALRAHLAELVQALGHHALTAGDAEEAQAHLQQGQQISLLLSELLTRAFNGVVIAARLGTAMPGLRILFLSRYPSEVVARLIGAPLAVVQLPASERELRSRIAEELRL